MYRYGMLSSLLCGSSLIEHWANDSTPTTRFLWATFTGIQRWRGIANTKQTQYFWRLLFCLFVCFLVSWRFACALFSFFPPLYYRSFIYILKCPFLYFVGFLWLPVYVSVSLCFLWFFFLTWLFVFLFICLFLYRFIFVLYYFIRHSF